MNAIRNGHGASGVFISNPRATRTMIYARTVELATLAGRPAHAINQIDYERAKREVTGEADFSRRQMIYDRMDHV